MTVRKNWRLLALWILLVYLAAAQSRSAPEPLLKNGHPVDWWFVFKLNSKLFSGCGGAARVCLFGGTVQSYKDPFGQQFVFASSANPTLQQGGGCLGDTTADPLGATFNQVYNGNFFYMVWNDQFDRDPLANADAPKGHSKGMLAWNDDGNGFVLQVSTPSWPGAGSARNPRTDGNTLGCVKDNDVEFSQHFFALKLNKDDLVSVLKALANASVATKASTRQIVNNGGPADVQALVKGLGKVSKSKAATKTVLSSGVVLISKPSHLNVPPWQMVSSMLDSEPLRAATWWDDPKIPTTTVDTPVGCWDPSLGKPGAVEIAITGTWAGKTIGLQGIPSPDGNHAKIGVSIGSHTYAIFGDLNQQGALSGAKCNSSQNGRGGIFFVVDNRELFGSVRDLITGQTAPAGQN